MIRPTVRALTEGIHEAIRMPEPFRTSLLDAAALLDERGRVAAALMPIPQAKPGDDFDPDL